MTGEQGYMDGALEAPLDSYLQQQPQPPQQQSQSSEKQQKNDQGQLDQSEDKNQLSQLSEGRNDSSLTQPPSISQSNLPLPILMFGQQPTSSHANLQYDLNGHLNSSSQSNSENKFQQQPPHLTHRQPTLQLQFHQVSPLFPPLPSNAPPPYSSLNVLLPPSSYYQQLNQQGESRHVYPFELRLDETQVSSLSYSNNSGGLGLLAPIPPLHLQQQMASTNEFLKQENQNQNNSNHQGSAPMNGLMPQGSPTMEDHEVVYSNCSRCKKEFEQTVLIPKPQTADDGQQYFVEPKVFKLCQHCRDLQRQRSRRWQKKTKDRKGVCRRCGSPIAPEDQNFVLCPNCRQNLRSRKASRAAQGKCVHCSGPLNAPIMTSEDGTLAIDNAGQSLIADDAKKESGKTTGFKVCQRCRANDKIRRTNLEKMGNCNRCAKPLDPFDAGKHKVCARCRSRKRKLSGSGLKKIPTSTPIVSNISTTFMSSVPNGYIAYDNSNMIYTGPAPGPDVFLVPSQYNPGYPTHFPSQPYPPVQTYPGNLQPHLHLPALTQTMYATQQPQLATAQYQQSQGLPDSLNQFAPNNSQH